MAEVEQLFDLTIATVAADETPPPGAHLLRIPFPDAPLDPEGWFEIPTRVTYVAPVNPPRNADKDRRARALRRKVDARYRFVEDASGDRFEEFRGLYLRTVAGLPRGIDRLGPVARLEGKWSGLYLLDGDAIAGGILLQRVGRHLSVSYGAFDPLHARKVDLEHDLILRARERSAALGFKELSLGVDTNRYGHHLSLGLPPYKWRIGFRAEAYRPAGREWIKPLRFEPFEEGLFFYAFGEKGLVGHLFAPRSSGAKAWRHSQAPPIVIHPVS